MGLKYNDSLNLESWCNYYASAVSSLCVEGFNAPGCLFAERKWGSLFILPPLSCHL